MSPAESATDRPTWQRFVFDAVFALLVGWVLYRGSCWLVAPILSVGGGFDVDWHLMSQDPFALEGRFPHRVLVPFLAWSTGYGGDGYMAFTHGLHVLLLASTFFVVCRLRGRYVDALMIAAVIAVTAPTQMYKLHWKGYTDPICYSLFLWSMVSARKPYVFWSLFLVNLFNHELAGFLLPWLWFLRRREDGRWRLDLLLVAIACGVYVAFYLLVKAQAVQLFSADYFLSHPLFPGGTFVVYNLAAIHWTCAFGPVLALLAWHQHTKGAGGERWHLWLVLLGIAVIFAIAFDWARHSNLLLLPLVVAATRFLAGGNQRRLVGVGLIGATLALFWLVPPWSPSAWPTRIFADPALLVDSGMLITGPGGPFDIGFGSLGDAIGRWLPRIWLPLLAVHAVGVAFWLLGLGLARWRSRAAATGPSPLQQPAPAQHG